MAFRILVVDDHIDDEDYPIYELPGLLRAANYDVVTSSDGEIAYDLVNEFKPHLFILDFKFDDLEVNGADITEALRMDGSTIPIILITNEAKKTTNILRGFEAGADDYVTYPCDNRVILARVRVNLPPDVVIINDYIEIDFINRTIRLKRDGVWDDEKFQPREFRLLEELVINANRTVSSINLKDRVWDDDSIENEALYLKIHRIRQKIEPDPKHPTYIITVQKIGYKFVGTPISTGFASIGRRTRCCKE